MTNTSTSTDSSSPATLEDVGIIVGRFQTPYLHDGHKGLIDKVVQLHKQVTIFLGVSPNKRSRKNPLDFEARRLMINEDYPKISVHPLSDMKSDDTWSKQLDAKIREIHPFSKVRLYGGRDSFIAHYLGSFPTTEIESTVYHTATSIRAFAGHDVRTSKDWREGVIYGAYNQYPKVWSTVDIAPIAHKEDGTYEVLLARKPGEKEWRFIGGFVDPTDECMEQAAQREVAEEAHIEVGALHYIKTQRIDDWRYRDDVDKVITTFFVATYISGCPQPDDDIEELGWFTFSSHGPRAFKHVRVVEAHYQLAEALHAYATKEGMYAKVSSNKSAPIVG